MTALFFNLLLEFKDTVYDFFDEFQYSVGKIDDNHIEVNLIDQISYVVLAVEVESNYEDDSQHGSSAG